MTETGLAESHNPVTGKPRRRFVARGYQVRRVLAVLMAGLMVSEVLAQTFALPAAGEDVIGEVKIVSARYEDTLSDIARAHHVGYEEIIRANPGVDPWLPGEGTRVIVPMQHILPDAPRKGLVLNLPEMRLYYYPPPQRGKPAEVATFPASIGRMDWSTPLGLTRVTRKVVNPVWYPPASVRAEHEAEGDELPDEVAAGPDNPLGEYALYLAVPGYLIHGTNRPYGIGMRVTHGCIRMYPEDIERLFKEVPVGTPVRIVNQPHKAGWLGGVLYLETNPLLEEDMAEEDNLTPAVRAVVDATRTRPVRVVWDRVMRHATEARGIPLAISE
jgi:L,D-transpeptidase ErfK/SrfK